jgi:glycosyltransferase involved in cell wall biosynthesis
VWALYPLAYAIQTAAYALEMLRALMLRGHMRAPAGRIGRGSEPRLHDYPGLVSLVMPTYNEAGHLAAHVAETLAAIDEIGCRHELIIVDDGSGDDTRGIAREAAAADRRVVVVTLDENMGKGFALVHGARAASGDLILCVDADLEVHPRQLSILYETLVRERADVVIGSKLHPRARIEYPAKRRILSLGYYALVRVLFGLPVRDTQTGLKLYKREALDRTLPRLVVKRFAHDLEVLVNVHRLGYRIAEAPVVVTRERDYPRIGGRDVRQIAQDTLAIWYRTYILHYYDRHVEPLAPPPEIYRSSPKEHAA